MSPPHFVIPPVGVDSGGYVGRAGNIVVSGVDAADRLRGLGLRVRIAPERVMPEHTDAGTRAVVLVARDADEAVHRADAIREWAHDSLLPLIAVVLHACDAEDPALWERALTCAWLGDDDHVVRLVTALDHGRTGLPTNEDAERTWELRYQLQRGPAAELGLGLDAFVVHPMVFVGGLLRPDASPATVVESLRVPAGLQLNTDGLRCTAPRP